MKPPIGIWRVLPSPQELNYAGPLTSERIKPRTKSGFGLSSVILPVVAALGVVAFFCVDRTFVHTEAKWISVLILPTAVVGFGVALANVLRRDKRKGFGIAGLILNIGLGVLGMLFWVVAHVAP